MSDERTLATLLDRQHGIVSRRQALARGMSKDALSWRLRPGGPWQVVLPCVYATFTGPLGEVHRCQAALLHTGDGAALTGITALRAHQLTMRPAPVEVPVLVPRERRRVRVRGVLLLRTQRMPRVSAVSGLAVADPVRALADACRICRDADTVCALVQEVVHSRRVRVAALRIETEAGERRGSGLLRQALMEYGHGVRSVAEAEARRKLLTLRIPRPRLNVDLYLPDGTFLARPDAYWPQAGLAFEVDSWSYHGDLAGWERTQRRHALMAAHGVAVVHASPHRVGTGWTDLGRELVAAYEVGRRRPAPDVRVAA